MGFRTLCLVLAIFVVHGWLRLIGIAAAVVLPWLAVVLANAGPAPEPAEPEYLQTERPALGTVDDPSLPHAS